jgi:hypothetical protein
MEILAERINTLLPTLMQKSGIDMWVLISREYNEDPVLKTFLPSTWISARRRTIIVFYYDSTKKQFDKLAIARYDVGETIKSAWDVKNTPTSGMLLLISLIQESKKNRDQYFEILWSCRRT